MFAVKTSCPPGSSSAAVLESITQIWTLIISFAPWIVRYGWVLSGAGTDAAVYVVFDQGCPGLICQLLLEGLDISTDPGNLGPIVCFMLKAPFWTRDELTQHTRSRPAPQIDVLKVQEVPTADNWLLWVREVDIKDVQVFFSKAHVWVYGSHRIAVRKIAPAQTPAIVFAGFPTGVVVHRFEKHELEAFDVGKNRSEMPLPASPATQSARITELKERLEAEQWQLELAELKLEEYEHQHEPVALPSLVEP